MKTIGERIENMGSSVTECYHRVEDRVVGCYKTIEHGAVKGFKTVTDACVRVLFAREGESVEAARARLSGKIKEEQ